MKLTRVQVGPDDGVGRIEAWLSKRFPALPRALVFKCLRQKDVRVNGSPAKIGASVAPGDEVRIYLPDSAAALLSSPGDDAFMRARGSLTFVYADGDVAVIDKPAGLASQPHADPRLPSVQTLLMKHLRETGQWAGGGAFVPSIANRLDTNTSGLMLAGTSARGLAELNAAIRERLVRKFYLCLTRVAPDPPSGTLKGYIRKDPDKAIVSVSDRRETPQHLTAVTAYRTLRAVGENALVEAELLTGRTHQIRAQFAHAGWPLVGERKYARAEGGGRDKQALHAHRLAFVGLDPARYPVLAALRSKAFASPARPDWLARLNVNI